MAEEGLPQGRKGAKKTETTNTSHWLLSLRLCAFAGDLPQLAFNLRGWVSCITKTAYLKGFTAYESLSD
jgi:uncharacterized membrane protein YgdD (TMEM256/DUF423 family)